MSLKKAAAVVRNNRSFIITAHTNLEGDALGSELAFYRLLRKMGKSAVIVNEDSTPEQYGFIPGADKIIKFRNNMRVADFDCLAILDCSDLHRTGEVYRINTGNKPILNIDHHISNADFGKVNWVDPLASSCSEMIYRLYRALHIKIDRDSALALYTGIIADTGSFRYSNTTAFTHRIASELLKFKLDIPQIYKNIYENIPLEELKILSRILPGLRQELSGRVIWFEISRGLYKKSLPAFDLSEQVLGFGRSVKGAELVLLFKENLSRQGEVRINFRSQGKVDVNKLAGLFGGGGHRTAAGATVKGKLQDVRKQVLARIRTIFK